MYSGPFNGRSVNVNYCMSCIGVAAKSVCSKVFGKRLIIHEIHLPDLTAANRFRCKLTNGTQIITNDGRQEIQYSCFLAFRCFLFLTSQNGMEESMIATGWTGRTRTHNHRLMMCVEDILRSAAWLIVGHIEMEKNV